MRQGELPLTQKFDPQVLVIGPFADIDNEYRDEVPAFWNELAKHVQVCPPFGAFVDSIWGAHAAVEREEGRIKNCSHVIAFAEEECTGVGYLICLAVSARKPTLLLHKRGGRFSTSLLWRVVDGQLGSAPYSNLDEAAKKALEFIEKPTFLQKPPVLVMPIR